MTSTIEDMDSSLLDVSADFISETPKKKPMSPKSFAKDVVERLAIVTPSGRVDAAEFLSSNTIDYTPGVVSLPEVTRKSINDILKEPLWRVLKEKAKSISKQTFLSDCIKNKAIPKGVTPKVPLKIIDPPQELSTKWDEILNECGTRLTTALDDFHKAEIAQIELKAAKVIHDASCELLPQFITEFPNIGDILEGTIREVKLDCAITTRRLQRKRSAAANPDQSIRKKIKTVKTIPSCKKPLKKVKPKKLFSKNLKEKKD
ncbi:uncharacterized protein [Dysidea avara]|uniref:uncharacterized protein isoform X3 n=1 Tax=Dysidea avara TaxID=196820 RepID=UPI003331AE4B